VRAHRAAIRKQTVEMDMEVRNFALRTIEA
jgi:hypothetical protein